MDQEIDKALASENGEAVQSQPKKKRKVESVVVQSNGASLPERKGFFDSLKSNFTLTKDASSLRWELKKLLLKHPDLDLQSNSEVESFVDSLDDDQIMEFLEHARFQLGYNVPNKNGLGFLGFIGDVLGRFYKSPGLARKLQNDKELVEMVEEMVPFNISWMSTPLQIVNRILEHMGS